MNPSNFNDFKARAQEIEAILRRNITGKQNVIAESLGWSEARFSRFKAGSEEKVGFTEMAIILAASGLSVTQEGVSISKEDLRALRYLAKRGAAMLLEGEDE